MATKSSVRSTSASPQRPVEEEESSLAKELALISDRVVRELQKHGIQARAGFKPMHLQEEYKGCRLIQDRGKHPDFVTPFPMSTLMAMSVIYLPLYSRPTPARLDAFDVIRRVLDGT